MAANDSPETGGGVASGAGVFVHAGASEAVRRELLGNDGRGIAGEKMGPSDGFVTERTDAGVAGWGREDLEGTGPDAKED